MRWRYRRQSAHAIVDREEKDSRSDAFLVGEELPRCPPLPTSREAADFARPQKAVLQTLKYPIILVGYEQPLNGTITTIRAEIQRLKEDRNACTDRVLVTQLLRFLRLAHIHAAFAKIILSFVRKEGSRSV